MLTSKEFKIYLTSMVLISLAAGILAAFFSLASAIVLLLTATLLILLSIVFTKARYREIKKLSEYLRVITSGNLTLDVRDNREGELSILKNEIYKVTLMLSEKNEQLQADKVILTNAISDISHQLKTPLTSMMILADLLNQDILAPEKRKEFTREITNQLERMEWLVSTLLKLSKIDAGTVQLKKELVNINQLVRRAADSVLIPMDIKEQNLIFHSEGDIYYRGDLNWTVEALINILKNCVEHTSNGGEISITCSENPLYTAIVIQDNGDGIAKEDIPYIFKRFYKGKNASEDSVGIGLAFAYQVVTSQGGDIEVKSDKGSGTQFTIKFYKQVI